MRFLWRSLTGLLIASLTLGLLALAVQRVATAIADRLADTGASRPASERVFDVTVTGIEARTVTPVIETFGQIQSRRTLELRTAAAGEIVWLSDRFEEGAAVAAGETLARIDDRDAVGRRDTAEADVAEAEAEVRDAGRALEIAGAELDAARGQADLQTRALERQESLLDRGVGTDAAVEAAALAASASRQAVLTRRQAVADAQARIDLARITLDRRRIALAEAERRVADTEIVAGFPGSLANVNAVEGGLVSANEALAELIDPDALETAFRVSAQQYSRILDPGGRLRPAAVTVSLDVGDLGVIARGRLTRESAAVGEGQTGRLLFARLESAAGFRPGDFVTVRIEEAPLDRVAVLPASAVDSTGFLLALGADDRLEAVQTRILRRQGDDVIVDAEGLAGLEVVAKRSPFLGAGIKVRPIRPDKEASAGPEDGDTDDLVELDDDRRARLVAFVEGNDRMPADAKERVLAQLRQDRVPARVVTRIESRMGG